MKDFLGNEIHVGDNVIFVDSWRSGYELHKGVVTKLTAKQVEIKCDDLYRQTTKRMPYAVIVLK